MSKDKDWQLFTKTVLLVSSTASMLQKEIDALIMERSKDTKLCGDLIAARRSLLPLAKIADHFEAEDQQ